MTKDIQVGDTLTVKALARRVFGDGSVSVQIGHKDGIPVAPDEIVHVEPRPIKVGDRVKWKKNAAVGVLKALDAGEAWVSWDEAPSSCSMPKNGTVFLAELTRINGEPS